MIFLAALLLGCNSEVKNSAPARAPAPTQTETGRFALQKMLVAAHLWARDAQPVRLESVPLPDSDGHDGKASFWRSTFASAAKQKIQTFTWSGSASPDTPRGIDHGTEDFFSPTNRTTQPWDLNYLKVDSDKAFAVAQEHGGKQLLAKKPAQPVMYLLDFDSRTPALRWHVIYGPGPASAPLSIIVDATIGEFVHKE
jgi:hypothetical protein